MQACYIVILFNLDVQGSGQICYTLLAMPDEIHAEPNTKTLANDLARKLRSYLLNGDLAEGDLVMTEAEVAERFQVSRGIAREAVSQLRAIGILKSRQSKGLIVGQVDPVDLFAQSLPFYHRRSNNLGQISRMRYVLEIGSIDLTVRNATDEQIERLATLAADFEAACEAQLTNAKINEFDHAFHRLLLEMTNDPLISGMHNVLADFFEGETRDLSHGINSIHNPKRQHCQHYLIVEAIRQRNAELARAILRQHLHTLIDNTCPPNLPGKP